MTRDPRTDPHPGDEVRIDASIARRVLKRDGGKLLIENFSTGFNHFWIRVGTWQKWCETSGAEVTKQEE